LIVILSMISPSMCGAALRQSSARCRHQRIGKVPLVRQPADKRADTFRSGGAWQHAIDRHPRAGGELRQAAGDGELRRLRHAVVDHLRRNAERRFAGDEHDAAAAAGQHFREIIAAQSDAAHDVDVQDPAPLRVAYVSKELGFVDPEIVDQNVGISRLADEVIDACRAAEIGIDAVDRCRRHEL
jgi:hypothetical protein